jgi:hypothetical protein
MKKLKQLKCLIDWIGWSSSNKEIIEELKKKLEVKLDGEFAYLFTRRNPQAEGTAEDGKDLLEKWGPNFNIKGYGLSVKGKHCDKIAGAFLFGKQCLELRKDLKLNRIDLKLSSLDVIPKEEIPSLEEIEK